MKPDSELNEYNEDNGSENVEDYTLVVYINMDEKEKIRLLGQYRSKKQKRIFPISTSLPIFM